MTLRAHTPTCCPLSRAPSLPCQTPPASLLHSVPWPRPSSPPFVCVQGPHREWALPRGAGCSPRDWAPLLPRGSGFLPARVERFAEILCACARPLPAPCPPPPSFLVLPGEPAPSCLGISRLGADGFSLVRGPAQAQLLRARCTGPWLPQPWGVGPGKQMAGLSPQAALLLREPSPGQGTGERTAALECLRAGESRASLAVQTGRGRSGRGCSECVWGGGGVRPRSRP